MPCARTPAPAGSIPSRSRPNAGPSSPGAALASGSGPFSLGSGCAGPVSFGGRLCRPRASSGGAVVPPVRRGGPRSTVTPNATLLPGSLTAA